MPRGSKRMKSTRMRPKMPGSSPGCFTKRSAARKAALLTSWPRSAVMEPTHDGTESRLRDDHREEGHEHRAEEGAVQAAEAAHHHHEEELDGQEHAEDVGSEEADLVREERARQAHDGGRVGKRHGL